MTSTETAGAVETEASRLAGVEKELNTLERRLKREARVSTFVTVVVLGLLCFYFAYGYREFSKLIQPQEIVSLGAALVDDNVTVVREAIQDEVSQSAPGWAEQLSNQAVEAVPLVREQLEEFAVAQAKASIEEYVSISEDEFRRVLKENHNEFQSLVNELSGEREATDEVVAALEEVLNKELGGDMQVAAADILETLQLAHEKLIRLGVGEDLSLDERKERQVMMLFRRFQMDEGSEMTLTGESSALSIFTTPLTELGLTASEDDGATAPVVSTAEPAKAALSPVKPQDEPPKPVTPQTAPSAPVSEASEGADNAAGTDDIEASATQGRKVEEAALSVASLQLKAAKAAQAATEQAVAAAKEAREATAEARKARDELRAAEKDARAAFKELIALQKQGDGDSEATEPAKDDAPTDSDAAAAEDDAPDDKDAPAAEDDAAETPKADPESDEKGEAASSDESS